MLRESTSSPSDASEDEVARRKSLGIYYTSNEVARILSEWAIRASDDTVLEPSFGGCSLLAASIDRLRMLGSENPIPLLRGFDVDEVAFEHLRRMLPRGKLDGFKRVDFLETSPVGKKAGMTAVVANPPFVSYHRMSEAQRAVVHLWREKNKPTFPATASLWAYFLVHALSFLKVGGRLAFILPHAALTADYAQPLMVKLSEKFTSTSIFRINEHIFLQAGTTERTFLLLCDGFMAPGPRGDRREESASSLEELRKKLFHADEICEEVECLVSVRSDIKNLVADKVVQGALVELRNLVNIKIGDVVGDTKFFVKPVAEWQRMGVHPSRIKPIVTRTKQLSGIQLTKSDASSASTAVPMMLTLSEGRLPKKIQAYIDSYPEPKRKKNTTFKKRKPWYAVPYTTKAKAFIGSMSSEAPRIFLNGAGVACANGLYRLEKRTKVQWHKALAAASVTTIFQLSAELQARIRGEGAMKLEPSDVLKLVVPASVLQLSAKESSALVSTIDALLRKGDLNNATQLADANLLIRPGIFNAEELAALRLVLRKLRAERCIN